NLLEDMINTEDLSSRCFLYLLCHYMRFPGKMLLESGNSQKIREKYKCTSLPILPRISIFVNFIRLPVV
ncbi:hypothetical protein ACJX0J_026711, partial [Zea mays]